MVTENVWGNFEPVKISIDHQLLFLRKCINNQGECDSIDYDENKINVGDHITWESTHDPKKKDALVVSVDDKPLLCVAIMEKVDFCQIKLSSKTIDTSKVAALKVMAYKCTGDMAELVKARAETWCTNHPSFFNVFTSESSIFPRYCKFGADVEWRIEWHAGQIITKALREALGSLWLTGKEANPLTTNKCEHSKRPVESGLYIKIADTAFNFQLDLNMPTYDNEHDNYVVFCDTFSKLLKNYNCLVYELFPGENKTQRNWRINIIPTNLIIPVVLRDLQKVDDTARHDVHTLGSSSSPITSAFSHAIHKTIKKSEDEIQLPDLRSGDHIVTNHTPIHPRCHAIVVSVKIKERQIKVIRNTLKYGVVERWEQVRDPILRVPYTERGNYPPAEVVKRARSKLGETKYNIATNNCKDFAYWCKYMKFSGK